MERISLQASVAVLPPLVAAALLLVARTVAEGHELVAPSVDDVLAATGVSRARAYDIATRVLAVAPTVVRAPGRPAKAAPAPAMHDTAATTRAVLDFVMRHPGCVDRSVRQRYSRDFRLFVVDLCAEHPEVDVATMSAAVAVPVGTLKDWLRAPRTEAPPLETHEADGRRANTLDDLHIQSVLDAWRRWDGSFVGFCDHVRDDLRIGHGRDVIRRILESEGLRRTARRPGRSPDERALRDAFKTYFPGAQWVGDGMQVPVVFDGRRFVFNVELDVDAHTAAFVGAAVSDTEDSAAVVDAFESGVVTTGAPPLALLLDNKPSNHTTDVDAALGETLRVRATPERPQNKAHVEGAFGLFSQALPPLVFDTTGTPRDCARAALALFVEVWAKTTNHRPRRAKGGRSRVELYAEHEPSDQEIENARRELRELVARQERARRTLAARRRPEVLALLDAEFHRLALLDPERHLRVAIARYPLDAILAGLAVFRAKRDARTLPDGADARYLLGIVKNVAEKTEGELFAEHLWDLRSQMRDLRIAALQAERDELCKRHDVAQTIATCVDRALEAAKDSLTRSFWLDSIVDVVRDQPTPERKALYLRAARRIEATYAVSPIERHDAVRVIADRLLKLE